ncbi:acyl-CoA dehydrogenase family protein [Hoyosella sp. YIM 151337]|uniref:acyl-CoA dehydrogenase family protein n=1 Tax=Hoyosella sp. YIM 151337 TaxID=2992742 RepID=UPI0022362739|nr:acyl-CoA dehydrogenase family protein [Hoyosella sp. YIM 151337]MCW4352382.1 acyl-CoA dehydrogenase family protein [Hoyosella sp. YIM 151337]
MGSTTLGAAAQPTEQELKERFQPIFDQIAEGAIQREKDRRLLFDEVELLRSARFGALRVPVELGGFGVSVRQLFTLLIDLAAAESNLPQALRVHWSFVEDQRLSGDAQARVWLDAVAAGAFVGNAITEPGIGAADRYQTVLTRDGDKRILNGTKYYSTGSLYSDYILVAADYDGERVSVLVDAQQPGVEQADDWDGFGQQLTVSGTTTFTDVVVPEDRILGPGYGAPGRTYVTAYLQLVQLAVLAGIAQRAEAETVEWVRQRTRTFTHAAADVPRNDPLVQQVIGKLAAATFGARAAVLAVADDLDVLLDAGGDDPQLLDQAEAAAAQAQSVVIGLVLDATSQLFEVGGASITSSGPALDRHWRNARTISAHNPLIFKEQALGAYLLNGDALPYAWSAGRFSKQSA